MKFFHNPEKGIYGSGNLRSRGFGYVWFLMYLYSFGGFPFDADMKPTVNSEAGKKAIEIYLRDKEVAFPDSPSWGTSQMIPHIAAGDVYSCQYWGGLIKLAGKPGEVEDRRQMDLRRRAGRRGQRQAALSRRRHAGRRADGQPQQPAQGGGRLYGVLARHREGQLADRVGPGQHASMTPGPSRR